MSLDVTEKDIAQAENGELDDEKFMNIVHRSLPFAYHTVERIVARIRGGEEMAVEAPLHMEDGDRNQLLRFFASTSMRGAAERHFGIVLGFQNCHKSGGTTPHGSLSPTWEEFTSIEGQILNQAPELRDC